jgi:plastocyanin
MAKKPKKNRKNITIELKAGVGAVPEVPTASKNPGDRVRWWNRTDRGHTIVFTNWPFVEPPQLIEIAKGAKSPWFTIYDQTLNTLYDYAIDPSINPPSGAPGDPGVLIGD